jgi:hypothetical protein
MKVLAYFGSQCTKFHAAGWICWYFMPFYLELGIWSDVISWLIWQVCINFCANLGKSATVPTKKLAVASWQCTVGHFLTRELLPISKMTAVPHPPYSPDLESCNFSLLLQLIPPFWHNLDEWDRIADSVEHSQNISFRINLKNGRRAGNSAHI